MDEATSNTDVYSTAKINDLLRNQLAEKTVIIVTHKMNVLESVDNIIFLKEQGDVVSGTYLDLMKDNEFLQMMEEEKRMDVF